MLNLKETGKMSINDENRPALANVWQSNGEGLKGVKAKEAVKNSQVEKMETDEVVEGVPKPVPRAGKKWGREGGGGEIKEHLHYTNHGTNN